MTLYVQLLSSLSLGETKCLEFVFVVHHYILPLNKYDAWSPKLISKIYLVCFMSFCNVNITSMLVSPIFPTNASSDPLSETETKKLMLTITKIWQY